MLPSQRLAATGVSLGPPPALAGPYRGVVEARGLLFVSAQAPKRGTELIAAGALGAEVDESALTACLALCANNVLSHLDSIAGGLDTVYGIVRSVIYVVAGQAMPIEWCASPVRRVFATAFGQGRTGVFVTIGAGGLPGRAPCVVESIAQRRPSS